MNIALQDWIFYATGALVGLIGLAIIALALFKDRSKGRRRCPKCWYDMSGLPGMLCPECGKTAKTEKKFSKTRRHFRVCGLGCTFLVIGSAAAMTPRFLNEGWTNVLPTPVLRAMLLVAGDEQMDAAYAKLTWGGWRGGIPSTARLTAWEKLLVTKKATSDYVNSTAQQISNIPMSHKKYEWTESMHLLKDLGKDAKIAVPVFAFLLEHGSPSERVAAVDALAVLAMSLPQAASCVQKAIVKNRDPQVRRRALDVLVRKNSTFGLNGTYVPRGWATRGDAVSRDKRIRQAAKTAIQFDPDPQVRQATIPMFVITDSASSAIILAQALANEENMMVRIGIARGLGYTKATTLTVEVILQAAHHESHPIGSVGYQVLGGMGTSAIRILGETLHSDLVSMRRGAAKALQYLGPKARNASDDLIKAASDEDEEVRYLVLKTIQQIALSDSDAIPPVIKLMGPDQPKRIRLAAIWAANAIAPQDERHLDALVKILHDVDGDRTVRYAAVGSLRRSGPRAASAVPALRQLQNVSDQELRRAVMLALEAIVEDQD